MITPDELNQLKAYVRYDGLIIGVIMCVTFILMMRGVVSPALGMLALILLVATPFVVGKRLVNYRDNILMKRVSFRRALFYTSQCFMYGGIILALVSYVYMRFVDGGSFAAAMTEALSKPEMAAIIKQNGMSLDEVLEALGMQTPVEVAISLLSNVLIMGFMASLLISLIVGREPRVKK